MKPILPALLLLTSSALASDISDLAMGFADAVQAMNRSTVDITCLHNGQTSVIKNVKEIRAFGGVLLITLLDGDRFVINSASVVRIAQ